MINEGLNDEPFTRQQFVFENDELILHAFTNGRDQLQSLEPSLAALAAPGHLGKDQMVAYALVVADGQRG